MDKREIKTKRSIINAFLQLRHQKPLERITIKELAELAEISKATFYLHYKDIYDLSDTLEKETVQSILTDIPHPEYFLSNHKQFMEELLFSFHAQQNIIDILFSGSRSHILPQSIEQALKEYIFKMEPQKKDDVRFNILLTHQILGGYYAYTEHRHQFSDDEIIDVISEITIRAIQE